MWWKVKLDELQQRMPEPGYPWISMAQILPYHIGGLACLVESACRSVAHLVDGGLVAGAPDVVAALGEDEDGARKGLGNGVVQGENGHVVHEPVLQQSVQAEAGHNWSGRVDLQNSRVEVCRAKSAL